MKCDICQEEVQAGQPRMGAKGDGGKSGAPYGYERHWKCHEAKYSKATPSGMGDAIRALRSAVGLEPEAPAIKRPVVTSGEYNQSENAGRSFGVLSRISEKGRSRIKVECPFCFNRFWVFIWSLNGHGMKKCGNCKAKLTRWWIAFPLAGNEDM